MMSATPNNKLQSPLTELPPPSGAQPNQQQQQFARNIIPYPTDRHQVRLLLARWNALTTKGVTEDESNELAEINRILRGITAKQRQYEERVAKVNLLKKTTKAKADVELLQAQTRALQLLSHNLELPPYLQATLLDSISEYPSESLSGYRSEYGSEYGSEYQSENGTRGSEIENSGSVKFEDREKRLSVPSSVILSKAEREVNDGIEQIIRNRVSQRLLELETLPANLGTIDATNVDFESNDQISANEDKLKINVLLELKALRLLTKQKSMRQHIVYTLASKSDDIASTMSARAICKRVKTQTAQELRLTEQLELQQRLERARIERQQKIAYVSGILDHCNATKDGFQDKKRLSTQLGKSILQAHGQIEKDEGRRAEKTAKQRLLALRSNDEEAYIKLLDQTKDTRITHLLRQTNSFLDSLSQAVRVQQQESNAETLADDEGVDANKKLDYYDVAHRVKEEVTKQPSILVGGKLKEYQIKGLQWMVSLYNNNLNGILADEMGLGKTIQSISLITYLIEMKKQPGPYLVIVPLSTLTNWTMEFEKWAPNVKKVVYKGPPNARKAQQATIRSGDFQVLLTTYEYIIKDRPLLSKMRWIYMIIDEGHRMKNSNSKLSYNLTKYYYSRHRLILTGTPLQNNLPELWALLNFVLPKIFNSVKTFDDWFNTPFANTGGQDKMELTEEETLLIIRRLHKVLRPFLLRRLKKDVEKDLPDKVEKVLKCKMSALQAKLYDHMLKYNVLFVGQQDGHYKSGVKGLNNKIMQLRKICNHPFVFEEVENQINPTHMSTDVLWRVAGKFELLDRIIPKYKATNHRILMFFQMTQVMDIMEDYLRLKGIQYLRLDGSTKADERSEMLKLFNAPNSPYFAFLLSTRAGGLGLNLQTADTVIIYDTDWNPHQDLQAQDRAHRIGQTKEVRILRLITEDSVEEAILERAHSKLEIDSKVIQAGKFDNKSTNEEQEAFLRSVIEQEEMRRTQKDSEEDEMDDDELNEILARNEDEREFFKKMDDERIATSIYGRGKASDRLFGPDELPEVYDQDIAEVMKPTIENLPDKRNRKTIHYDDGLTEEQWLDAVDNDEDTIEAAIERKRIKQLRRAERRAARDESEGISDSDSAVGTPEINGRPKRKRRSTKIESDSMDDSILDESGDFDVDERPVKRRGRQSGRAVKKEDLLTPEERDVLNTKANKLISTALAQRDETGRDRSLIFIDLPSKKIYPDYYAVIEKPVAINVIKRKLKLGEYQSLADVKADFKTMFENARIYNEPESFVCADATAIEEAVNKAYTELTPPTTIKISLSHK